ncbi:hypothetical protein PG985_010411 [Apiospora marii]|uniref:uncharacterized protein n=1 Tax=Apiospora marii TaxID=335849 RepID=UPI00312E00F1
MISRWPLHVDVIENIRSLFRDFVTEQQRDRPIRAQTTTDDACGISRQLDAANARNRRQELELELQDIVPLGHGTAAPHQKDAGLAGGDQAGGQVLAQQQPQQQPRALNSGGLAVPNEEFSLEEIENHKHEASRIGTIKVSVYDMEEGIFVESNPNSRGGRDESADEALTRQDFFAEKVVKGGHLPSPYEEEEEDEGEDEDQGLVASWAAPSFLSPIPAAFKRGLVIPEPARSEPTKMLHVRRSGLVVLG